MKRIAGFILAAAMVLSLAACAGNSESAGNSGSAGSLQSEAENSRSESSSSLSSAEESGNEQSGRADVSASEADSGSEKSRILVAFFSATNNTEHVAQTLAEGLGADLYEIVPEQPYSDADLNYGDPNSRSSVEMNDPAARPAIAGEIPDMAQYDIVFIGYPIWWGEAPRILSTFIESGDFSGKTLVAFCTSASSGFGSSDAALRDAAGAATWLDGHRFSAGASADEVRSWADGLEIQ